MSDKYFYDAQRLQLKILKNHSRGKNSTDQMVTRNDAHDSYEYEEDIIGENMQEENKRTRSNGRREQITIENLMETMQSFIERLAKVQEEQNRINIAIFQSLIDM